MKFINYIFKKIYYALILLGSSTRLPKELEFLNIYKSSDNFEISFTYKVKLMAKIVLPFSPLAFLLEQFGFWFNTNAIFFSVVLWSIVANIIFGAWLHWKKGDFKLKILLIKNLEMCVIILMAYPILEGISTVTGDNITGEIFKIAIQIATILFPAGKALKNAHILSNYQYPSHFIMQKIYRFEKDGNVKDLFEDNDKTE